MPEIEITLLFSAFIAGLLMFLAPCTLPLVPAYLAFISGVSEKDAKTQVEARRKIRQNGLMFVLGFTFIFVSFGVLAGYFGTFIGQYRALLSQVGGAFIILFGLMMLGLMNITPLMKERKLKLPKSIAPGQPVSALLMGSIFALGWTPCVGPVLAAVLLIASTKATVFSGALLLLIFSLGLAIPFLVTSLLYSRASGYIDKYSFLSQGVSIVGGIFLILIGVLLLMGDFGLTVRYGYEFFNLIGAGNLFNYY